VRLDGQGIGSGPPDRRSLAELGPDGAKARDHTGRRLAWSLCARAPGKIPTPMGWRAGVVHGMGCVRSLALHRSC